MDRVKAGVRSRIMGSIRASGTGLEAEFCTLLKAAGAARFRRNVASLPGKPDVVFTAARLAVFVDSCFWHGCPRHLRRPISNVEYWNAKLRRNRQRDRQVTRALTRLGWSVVRVWEHQLKDTQERMRVIRTIISALPQNDTGSRFSC